MDSGQFRVLQQSNRFLADIEFFLLRLIELLCGVGLLTTGARIEPAADQPEDEHLVQAAVDLLRRERSRAMSVSPREYKGEPYSKEPAFG
jgi:hypothetical protein